MLWIFIFHQGPFYLPLPSLFVWARAHFLFHQTYKLMAQLGEKSYTLDPKFWTSNLKFKFSDLKFKNQDIKLVVQVWNFGISLGILNLQMYDRSQREAILVLHTCYYWTNRLIFNQYAQSLSLILADSFKYNCKSKNFKTSIPNLNMLSFEFSSFRSEVFEFQLRIVEFQLQIFEIWIWTLQILRSIYSNLGCNLMIHALISLVLFIFLLILA